MFIRIGRCKCCGGVCEFYFSRFYSSMYCDQNGHPFHMCKRYATCEKIATPTPITQQVLIPFLAGLEQPFLTGEVNSTITLATLMLTQVRNWHFQISGSSWVFFNKHFLHICIRARAITIRLKFQPIRRVQDYAERVKKRLLVRTPYLWCSHHDRYFRSDTNRWIGKKGVHPKNCECSRC